MFDMGKKSGVGAMASRLIGGAISLAVILLTPAASAEPAYDRCAYMHHASKAYAACMSDQAAAAEAAKTSALTASNAPKAEPKSNGKAKAAARP